jgi:hypothetical protein
VYLFSAVPRASALAPAVIALRGCGASRYLIKRKDEVDESCLGLSVLGQRASSDTFFSACEHIRGIDGDLADEFAVMMKKHKKGLKSAAVSEGRGPGRGLTSVHG